MKKVDILHIIQIKLTGNTVGSTIVILDDQFIFYDKQNVQINFSIWLLKILIVRDILRLINIFTKFIHYWKSYSAF